MVASFPTREGYVSGAAGKVWWQIVGGGGAIPLVIVHGGPGASHDYLEPLRALADERLVVFYDQLGGGKSDRPDDVRLWRNERFVAELGDLIDALALDQVHLLGHSWGAILATEYALQRPDRLASLVLAGPPLSLPRYAASANALRATLPEEVRTVLDRHEAAGATDSADYEAATMEFYRRHICRLDPWPEPLLRSFANLNLDVYNTMQGPNEFVITGIHKDYDVTDRLAEIDVPTLLTCGRYDTMRPEDTAWYAARLPRAEVAVFEQSSHTPHLEEPDRYLQVVRDHLRRVEAG